MKNSTGGSVSGGSASTSSIGEPPDGMGGAHPSGSSLKPGGSRPQSLFSSKVLPKGGKSVSGQSGPPCGSKLASPKFGQSGPGSKLMSPKFGQSGSKLVSPKFGQLRSPCGSRQVSDMSPKSSVSTLRHPGVPAPHGISLVPEASRMSGSAHSRVKSPLRGGEDKGHHHLLNSKRKLFPDGGTEETPLSRPRALSFDSVTSKNTNRLPNSPTPHHRELPHPLHPVARSVTAGREGGGIKKRKTHRRRTLPQLPKSACKLTPDMPLYALGRPSPTKSKGHHLSPVCQYFKSD